MSESSPINPWSSILRNLPLSKAEIEVVRRFEIEPEGRSFLAVADILRSHRLVDEALELLSQGVENHPHFTVSRVVLARELLQKGMVEAAWRVLDDSPTSLRSNVMAQKIKLKLALLQAFEPEVVAILKHLDVAQLHDSETKRLADIVSGSGHAKAREKLLQEMRDKGIEPLLPQPRVSPVGSSEGPGSESLVPHPAPANGPPTPTPSSGDALSPSWSLSDYLDMESLAGNTVLSGFHVTSLTEIFRPDESAAPDLKGRGGVELDSTTLADIYAGQGHYGKALEMYRRILRVSPQNDLVRRRVSELARLERDQRSVDLTIDPSLVDLMEAVEIIDRQIKFYNDLLTRLSG